jgi:hypothetical protein
MKVRKTGKVLEIVEGGDDLEEGKVALVYTVADLRRVLCLEDGGTAVVLGSGKRKGRMKSHRFSPYPGK